MEKVIRAALLITISILYATTVFLLSRSVFPVPDAGCIAGPDQASQECWQNYESARKSTESSQRILAMVISAATVVAAGMSKMDRDIRASILVGAGITAIISSGISEIPLAGAVLSGIVLVGIVMAVRKS